MIKHNVPCRGRTGVYAIIQALAASVVKHEMLGDRQLCRQLNCLFERDICVYATDLSSHSQRRPVYWVGSFSLDVYLTNAAITAAVTIDC